MQFNEFIIDEAGRILLPTRRGYVTADEAVGAVQENHRKADRIRGFGTLLKVLGAAAGLAIGYKVFLR